MEAYGKGLELEPDVRLSKGLSTFGFIVTQQIRNVVGLALIRLRLFRPLQNDTIRKSLATAKSKLKSSVSSTSRGADLSSPGQDSPGMPGLGGAGGMPDLSALMNNPMMAQMFVYSGRLCWVLESVTLPRSDRCGLSLL